MQEEPWFEVQVSIPACTWALQYQGWKAKSEGRTPWEDAQVVAFEILSTLCQQHGDSLTNSAAGSIPQVDLALAIWRQYDRVSMVRDCDKRAQSSSPAMSAMFAVMQMFYAWEGCNTLVLSIAFGTCISWAQASSKHSWAWAYVISCYSLHIITCDVDYIHAYACDHVWPMQEMVVRSQKHLRHI